MLLLPTFNATLQPCPVNPAEFTPHPQGHFCGQCQRVVHDFSRSTDPRADLAAARAVAPDGRVCGRFGAAQVQAAPALSRRRRWFVVALVLVVAQGLTAREALAQVRRATPGHRYHPATVSKHAIDPPIRTQNVASGDVADGMVLEEPKDPSSTVYTYAQQMPTFQGGDLAALTAHIQQQLRWPQGSGLVDAEGRVFASFIVGKDGMVRDAKIIKGLHPFLDAEALRVILALTGFTPGRQNGKPVAVSVTVPVTFRRK